MNALHDGEAGQTITRVSPFDRIYGLDLTSCGPERVTGLVPVEERVTQVSGLVHGGVYAAMAETLASLGTNCEVGVGGKLALGSSNYTSFLRPISKGAVHGTARRMRAGATTWVWDVEFVDDEGRLCALSRVTVAVRLADRSSSPAD